MIAQRGPNCNIIKEKTSKLSRNGMDPPNLRDFPSEWFDYYTIKGKELISREQITYGLFDSVISLKSREEERIIRKRVNDIWCVFTSNERGEISKWNFLCQKGGMANILITIANDYYRHERLKIFDSSINQMQEKKHRHSYLPFPLLSQNSSGWFDYFDRDESGTLSQKELVYALYATFNATSKERQYIVKNLIKSNWERFDVNCQGCISKEIFLEFECGDSLAEILIDLELDLNIKAVDRPQNDTEEVIVVKVNIPEGLKPFDLIQVHSPRTKELVMISIPDQTVWGGRGYSTEPYYFTVSF